MACEISLSASPFDPIRAQLCGIFADCVALMPMPSPRGPPQLLRWTSTLRRGTAIAKLSALGKTGTNDVG
jgi:hypothetical protein